MSRKKLREILDIFFCEGAELALDFCEFTTARHWLNIFYFFMMIIDNYCHTFYNMTILNIIQNLI